jgi:hypothetical protein
MLSLKWIPLGSTEIHLYRTPSRAQSYYRGGVGLTCRSQKHNIYYKPPMWGLNIVFMLAGY